MYSGIQRFSALERVSFGKAASAVLSEEIELSGHRRVMIVTNKSLDTRKYPLQLLREVLGDRLAGVFSDVPAHGPQSAVLAGAKFAREIGADVIVALGGGSVIDAAKVMLLALWNDITDEEALSSLRLTPTTAGAIDPSRQEDAPDGRIRMIAIPTTLSAAEFAHFAGAVDSERRMKNTFGHPLMMPQMIILDPEIVRETPLDLFLSSGVKAVDHAVERICSLAANPVSDAMSAKALVLLANALPRVKEDPVDITARLDCQVGMWLSMMGGGMRVTAGASHGIGHVLGAHCGLRHGDTSCVILPAVLQWNSVENADRQKLISALMGDETAPAADLVRDLVKRLGLPTSLSAVNVAEAEFPIIAEKAMQDRLIPLNPRKISGPEDIFEILRLAG